MTTASQHLDVPPVAPVPPTGPLFVLSVWRSGSSLLYTLLNQHSQVALLYEGDLPQIELFLWGRLRNGEWRERWEFWNQAPSRHGIALDSMPARVSDVWDATRLVYQDVARRKQATVWGEKTPHWYDCPLRMAERFPDARFIFLWRDLHSVIESMSRAAVTHHFFRKAGLKTKAILGSERLRQACDTLRAQGRPVHEINYEDLTSDTGESMQRICHFLEIPFEPRITTLEGADRSAIAGREREHHAMVQSDRIVGRKRQTSRLSPAMRAKIDRYACRWKQRYGGRWPKYPVELRAEVGPPSLIELWRDRTAYQILLCWEKVVALIYALTPLALARLFRSRLRRRSLVRKLLAMSQ